MGNYEDVQVELTYISIPNPPFCSSRPAFGQHNPVYVPAPGPARQAAAGGPASSSPPDELTAAAQFVAQNPQLSVRMLTYICMYMCKQSPDTMGLIVKLHATDIRAAEIPIETTRI